MQDVVRYQQFSITTFGGEMLRKNFVRISLFALSLSIFDYTAHAQPATEFQPQVGQDGKDVIWVPTPQALVDKMLDMAKVTPNDYVIDLGSGDGRTVITAAKRGARALGIAVSYTHLRAHETGRNLVCRLLLEKKKQ